jgi:acyl carrier protein
VVGLIKDAIDDVNMERDAAARIAFSEQTPLYGSGSQLDSLDFVNFTVGLEERLRQHGTERDLAAILFDPSQPFRSVGSLAEFISRAPGA